MVAPATPRLDFAPEVNLSRLFLHRAYAALDADKKFECGVLLREAVRRQLYAECAWKGCLPQGVSDRTPPIVLLKTLRSAGHCNQWQFDNVKEIADFGNRAAHCHYVKAGDLRSAIAFWHMVIDGDPCGEPRERVVHCKPSDAWHDYDAADFWKAPEERDHDDTDDEGGALVKGGPK